MEAWVTIEVWVGDVSLDGSGGRVGLFHGNVLTFSSISPSSEQDNVSGITVQGITGLKLILSNVGGNGVHGEGSQSWLGELPAHWNKAWAISSVSIIASSLVVWDVFVDPILTSGDHGASGNTLQVFGFLALGLHGEKCAGSDEDSNACQDEFFWDGHCWRNLYLRYYWNSNKRYLNNTSTVLFLAQFLTFSFPHFSSISFDIKQNFNN